MLATLQHVAVSVTLTFTQGRMSGTMLPDQKGGSHWYRSTRVWTLGQLLPVLMSLPAGTMQPVTSWREKSDYMVMLNSQTHVKSMWKSHNSEIVAQKHFDNDDDDDDDSIIPFDEAWRNTGWMRNSIRHTEIFDYALENRCCESNNQVSMLFLKE